jgi:hypothetical protein
MANLEEVLPSFQSVEEAVDHLGGDPSSTRRPNVRRTAWRRST